MNSVQSIEKLKAMRLFGIVAAYQSNLNSHAHEQLTQDEFLAYLIDAEWQDRYNRRIQRLTAQAKFRYKAFFNEIDFNSPRNLNKDQLVRLSDGSFIKNKENIIITGATGVGKSFIASALGHQGCHMGYKTYYSNASRLFARLKGAKADGSYLKEINRIEKQDLLILDDFGLQPLDNIGRVALMEIIEDRHGRKATIISSQLPVNTWHEVIGESNIADAILDRLVHTAHRIKLEGESMRKVKK
ncbi:MAG: IS21-like element helper ATPase IstB [Cyclobacteriaceae bacterium]